MIMRSVRSIGRFPFLLLLGFLACFPRGFRSFSVDNNMGEKQLAVQRVWVRECLDCNAMKPTKAGQEKIARGMSAFMMLMFR